MLQHRIRSMNMEAKTMTDEAQKSYGGRPCATAEQIISAFLEDRCISRVCRRLRASAHRVERILDDAGVERTKREYDLTTRNPKEMPEIYVNAIAEYQAGARMPDLKKRY